MDNNIKCVNCAFMQQAESQYGICDKFSELNLLTESNDLEPKINEMKASIGVIDIDRKNYVDYDANEDLPYIPQLTVYVGHDFFCGNFKYKK